MTNKMCSGSAKRSRLAVSLSFASAILLSLEALHPGSCAWLGLDAEQSFALSATLATISVFLGSLILTRLITPPIDIA